jgi:hypothetical protein
MYTALIGCLILSITPKLRTSDSCFIFSIDKQYSANQNSTTRIHVQLYNRTSSLSVSLSALLNSYNSNEHSFSFGNRMYIWRYTRSRSVQLTRSRPAIMAEFDMSLPFRDQTRVVQLQIQSAMPSYVCSRENRRGTGHLYCTPARACPLIALHLHSSFVQSHGCSLAPI